MAAPASLASPIEGVPSTRQAQGGNGAPAEEYVQHPAILLEVAREVRRSGGATTLGMDDLFLSHGESLQNQLLRDRVAPGITPGSRQATTARNSDQAQDLFRETIDSALRATRETLFDGGDSASFSLAGLELSVSLKGDRRGVIINGYEVLGANRHAVLTTDDWQPPEPGATPDMTERAARDAALARNADLEKLSTRDLLKLAFHPVTLVVGFALLAVWLFSALAGSASGRD